MCAFMDSWAVERGHLANLSERQSTIVGYNLHCEGLGYDPGTETKMSDHPFACHLYSHYYAEDNSLDFVLLNCPFVNQETEIPTTWLVNEDK